MLIKQTGGGLIQGNIMPIEEVLTKNINHHARRYIDRG
jgi:hypothetical protein